LGRGGIVLENDETIGVSIPQSEFCPLGPKSSMGLRLMIPVFQFLSRNSVRWDKITTQPAAALLDVSIPQSEFCPLGP